MIPEFPEFKKLSVEDGPTIDAITNKFPTYSDYNFSSLWGWDTRDQIAFSMLNGNLVVRFTDYETGEPFLSFIGQTEPGATAETLLAYSEAQGLGDCLRLVPEVSINALISSSLKCIPDEDNFDYVYLTKDIATLEGNRYSSKRKLRNRFIRENGNHEFKICDLSEADTQQAIRSIIELWGTRRDVDEDAQSIQHEVEAIENVFILAKNRPIFAGMVFLNDKPVAFTIEEVVNGNLSIGHFWKATSGVPGEYEFLASKTAQYLVDRGVFYWNWEQDLGIPSLRASKSSYRPSELLRKFTIRKRKNFLFRVMLGLRKFMPLPFTNR